MSFTNFQKTIALTSGVLVLSGAIVFVAFAVWQGPSANPPLKNAVEPINIGPDAQTKQGAFAVSYLFASDNKVFLNDDGEEGDIERVNYIKGQDGLYLDSDPFNIASIHLGNINKEVKFSIKGDEKMKVDKNGKMYISKLNNCFLEADENGKIRCYAGGQIPDGDEFLPGQAEILHVDKEESDSHIIADQEAVVKVVANISAYSSNSWADFKFYINEIEQEHIHVIGGFRYDWPFHDSWWNYNSGTWYYHIQQYDEIKIVTDTHWNSEAENASASVYKLEYKRDVIDYASCEGAILYYYDINSAGKMNEIENQYNPDVPVSVAITSDGLPISFPEP